MAHMVSMDPGFFGLGETQATDETHQALVSEEEAYGLGCLV